MRRTTPRLLGALLALVVTAGLALAAPAAAGEPCWQTVINDWADNARVDGRYPIHCYRDALRNLPEDMRAYSSAPDDIERAMRAEMLRTGVGSSDSLSDDAGILGGSGGTPGSGEGSQQEQSPPYQGTGYPDPDDDQDESSGILERALDKIGPGDATSFPLPLLVLGGLLGVFLIAGGLGYVARRGAPGGLRIGRR